jgi:hypothetical protein
MKNIIRKILKESEVQPKRLFKYVEHSLSTFDDDVEEVIEDLEENLNLTKLESYIILFEYYIHIGADPVEMSDFDNLSYYFHPEDVVRILRNSGWLDRYLTDKTSFKREFRDIIEVGDGEKFLLKLDDWEEFSCLFDDNFSIFSLSLGKLIMSVFSIISKFILYPLFLKKRSLYKL